MRIHHLACTSMHPHGGRLMHNRIRPDQPAKLVCHCLLVETEQCLVLVDTGFGTQDLADPRRMGRALYTFGRPTLDPEETAIAQVRALGFDPADVRHVVVTHLDLDHAGGLPDFPHARVHLLAAEKDAALEPRTLMEKNRYQPLHWAHGPAWEAYTPTDGEPWRGFEAVRDLRGLPPEILLVPLAGHTRGHAGVALRTGDGWLLHCGDAYFFRGDVDPHGRTCPAGLRLFQNLVNVNRRERLHNQERLRELVRDHGSNVRTICAHDPVEWERSPRG